MDAIFVVWIASSVVNVKAVKSLAGACELAQEVKGRAFRADYPNPMAILAIGCLKYNEMWRAEYFGCEQPVPEPITTEVCIPPAAGRIR